MDVNKSSNTRRELQKHNTKKQNEGIIELYQQLKETEPSKTETELADTISKNKSFKSYKGENFSKNTIRKVINQYRQDKVKTLWENNFCSDRHGHRIHEFISRIEDHISSDQPVVILLEKILLLKELIEK